MFKKILMLKFFCVFGTPLLTMEKAKHGVFSIMPFDAEKHTRELVYVLGKNSVLAGQYEPALREMLGLSVKDGKKKMFEELRLKVLRAESGRPKEWEIKGFIAYSRISPFTGQISMIAVKEEDRRRGYAHALLSHAIDDLRQQFAEDISAVVPKGSHGPQGVFRKVASIKRYDYKLKDATSGVAGMYQIYLTPKNESPVDELYS